VSDTTTNFDEWLDAADPPGFEGVFALHEAVSGETEFASYKCERALNGQLIVSAPRLPLKLRLVNGAAKEGFLKCIHARYVDSGMDIAAWYGMNVGLASEN